ncbi:MAG: acetate kinase, partial [Parasporobacterium sp.]|nr:acetate kinase [Parasporobacterium sp.]
LTPLEGLMMGTRSGDIDPGAIEYIAKKENLDLDGIMEVLNKKSGMAGLSEISSDFRDIDDAIAAGNKHAIDAMAAFVHRVAFYVGGYAAIMNGVDAIVFTAGVGENSPEVRRDVCAKLGYLGIEINQEKNFTRNDEMIITTPDSKVKVLVVATNEELMIARETLALLK